MLNGSMPGISLQNVIMIGCHFVECHYSEYHYTECHYSEYHNAECHFAQFQYAGCHFTSCRYIRCHFAQCHYARCHFAECHYTQCQYAGSHSTEYNCDWCHFDECHDAWSQCYKTLIYCHSTVTPSFCVIKQYYDGNDHGMPESNTKVIYRGISTPEITGIFITLAVNYCGT